jgi:nucleoside-diphosphate-sugar epimerase
MTQSLLVTGGRGFIGRALVSRLTASREYSLRLLTRQATSQFDASVNPPIQIVGDLLDSSTYQKEVEGCDIVVHLAAVTGRAAPREYSRVNVGGTQALLKACKTAGVRKFLHVSTIAAGYADQSYYPYAKTKAEAEAAVRGSGLDYAIVRPTIVLGPHSPVWNTLLKIAKLPLIPLPQGRRPVMIAPIHVDDVARALEVLLESGRLEGEVLDVGGPEAIYFREFLEMIQSVLHGRPGRIASIPLGLIRAPLSMIEPIARPLMPVTAGQLAVFANDSVPAENWLLARIRADMPSTSDMISALLAPGHVSDGPGPRASSPRRPRLPTSNAKQVIEKECKTFATYITGKPPSEYITEQYASAALAHGLASDDDLSCFERVSLALGRSGSVFTRSADAFCSIFARRGVLRRKLIVLAAILENVSPTSEALDRVASRSAAGTLVSLVGYGAAFTVSFLLGATILLPAAALCRMVGHRASAGLSAGSRK